MPGGRFKISQRPGGPRQIGSIIDPFLLKHCKLIVDAPELAYYAFCQICTFWSFFGKFLLWKVQTSRLMLVTPGRRLLITQQ